MYQVEFRYIDGSSQKVPLLDKAHAVRDGNVVIVEEANGERIIYPLFQVMWYKLHEQAT